MCHLCISWSDELNMIAIEWRPSSKPASCVRVIPLMCSMVSLVPSLQILWSGQYSVPLWFHICTQKIGGKKNALSMALAYHKSTEVHKTNCERSHNVRPLRLPPLSEVTPATDMQF